MQFRRVRPYFVLCKGGISNTIVKSLKKKDNMIDFGIDFLKLVILYIISSTKDIIKG